ncbi:Uncharacterised protein [uncultured archaeon]|nr:Uncharacterised protein [uncultured archaeon]
MNRTSGGCEENCVYYKPITMGREVNEGLPVYKVLKSKTEGSYVIIVSRERTDGKLQYIAVLIDAWKMGLKDCFGSNNITKQEFQKKLIKIWGKLTIFAEISLSEALWFVKYGLRIAKEVKTRIPLEFEEFKYILGNMDDVKVEGSLYKCFKCEKGELSDEVVKLIKEVAGHDMAAHVCGTPAETMIYCVCDECR